VLFLCYFYGVINDDGDDDDDHNDDDDGISRGVSAQTYCWE